MSDKVVRISDWPFENNEKAKLVWIGEPFSQNKKWMVKVYLRSVIKRETKVVIVDWPTIHFLSVGKTYSNGIINQSEIEEGSRIIDVNLENVEAIYNEREWHIQGTNEKGISRTFSFKKEKKLYIIPSIEIIRGILGIDGFTLRLLLSMDAIENYFTYEIQDDVLKLYFTNEYNKKLLTKEKIYHLAWVLTNKNVLRMFNEISNNYVIGGLENLKFDFLIDNLKLQARIRQKENKVFVQELLQLKNKNMAIKEIQVGHPMLSSIQRIGAPKQREFITYTHIKHKDIQLETEIDGATKGIDLIESKQIIHSYNTHPIISKDGLEKEYRRIMGDENTRQYFHDDKGKRTLADMGGDTYVKGLDFLRLEDIQVIGELEEFIQTIKLLESKAKIKRIEMSIGNLPVSNGGKFSRLNDELTPRRYVLCRVITSNKKENLIIEVEKEQKSLSMLILQSNKSECFNYDTYNTLLCGLVKNCGSWDKSNIKDLEKLQVNVIRKKHTTKDINKLCEQIYLYVTS